MKTKGICFFTAILWFAFIFSSVAMVKAQETSDFEFTLEEITVTAQKREENQQKVPIAMEVMTGDDIKELARNDIDEILTNVASVLINKASDGLRVSIRGISDDGAQFKGMQASTPTVAMNKDGVYTNRKNSGSDLYDVERIEVLFGPQSTLYATASPGGIVNIVSATPNTDKYSGSAVVEYGNYNLVHTEGAVNVPISDTMALRAAFSTSTRDGYLSNGTDDEDAKSLRVRGLYRPNDIFSVLLTGEISKSAAQGIASVEAFDDQDDVEPWTASSDLNAGTGHEKQKKIYANMAWDLAFGTISVIPAYSKRDYHRVQTEEDMMTGAMVTKERNGDGYEKGLEFRAVSSEDFFFKWIFGGNWYETKDDSDDSGDDGSWSWNWNLQEVKSLYGNVTYPVTDRFRTTGGLRYSWDENNSEASQYPDAQAEATGDWVQVSNMEYDGMDYKLGVEYDISDNSMLYADYSTSYRNQGLSFSRIEEIPPEELKAYTIGAKNQFLGNKLQVNVSAYYYDYTNYSPDCPPVTTLDQKDLNDDGDYDDESLYDPETGETRNETITADDDGAKQIADLEVYGVDLQANMIITRKDKLDMSVSWIKKEFTDLIFDFEDITNELGIEDIDYSGKSSVLSPEWTITFGYSHNFQLWNGGTLTARIDTKYQSEYFLTYAEKSVGLDRTTFEPTITYAGGDRIQEAYHLSNLTAIYAHPDGNWTLTGYVKNFENYAVKRSYMQSSLVIGAPRTYGAVLSVKF